MNRITIGSIIKNVRVRKNLTREQAAKRVRISAAYFGHLERNSPVHISDDLVKRLIRALGPSVKPVKRLALKHNTRARKIIRTYPSTSKSYSSK